MKVITINLPEPYLEAIEVLTDLGVYDSRSEAIRSALKDFLGDELMFLQNLETENLEVMNQ